jgi:hypothetical protein
VRFDDFACACREAIETDIINKTFGKAALWPATLGKWKIRAADRLLWCFCKEESSIEGATSIIII